MMLRMIMFVVLASGVAAAQYPWSGILDPSRGIDWSHAGIPGGIPNITVQCGPTVNPSLDTTGTADTAAIIAALSTSCAGQFVQLAAGTFYTNGQINIPGGVVLRGMGATQTIVRMNSTLGGGSGYAFVLGTNPSQVYSRSMSVASTASKGDYTVTVIPGTPASLSLLAVGQLVWISDLNDWFPDCTLPNTTTTSRCINTWSVENGSPGGGTAWAMDGVSQGFSQRAAGQMDRIVNCTTTTPPPPIGTPCTLTTLTLEDPLVDSFHHPLPDWMPNSPPDVTRGFVRGSAIFPARQTPGTEHVYYQTTVAGNPAASNSWCLTGPTEPVWPKASTTPTWPSGAAGTWPQVTETSPGTCVWQDAGPGTDSIPRLMYFAVNERSGLENLQIYGVNNLQIGNFFSLVLFGGCSYCWARGVEINRAVGFIMRTAWAFHGQIEQGYYTTPWWHGSGTDSVIALEHGTSGFLVQNNIFERTPEAVFTDHGGSGNVIAYNYSVGNWGANGMNNFTNTILSHQGHPWFNLTEGNIVQGISEDSVHGSSSLGTRFRNWVQGSNLVCQPVQVLGLNNAVVIQPGTPTVQTNAVGGATTYTYVVAAVVGGAASNTSAAATIATGPAALSPTATNTITTPATSTVGDPLTSAPRNPGNPPVQGCQVYRTNGPGGAATQGLIGTVTCGQPLVDNGQGVGQRWFGAGYGAVPETTVSCTQTGTYGQANAANGFNSWFSYQSMWTAQQQALNSRFSDIGNVYGSKDMVTSTNAQSRPMRRKVCGLCDNRCVDNRSVAGTCGAGETCCGTNARNGSAATTNRSFGFISNLAASNALNPDYGGNPADITLAQDFQFSCLNYYRANVEASPSRAGVEAEDCPSSTVLPASFYLTSKPGWWGNTLPFPAIGPDIVNGTASCRGDTTGAGANCAWGYANNIPAKDCYERVMGGTDTSGAPFPFEPGVCYANAPPMPAAQFSVVPSSIPPGGTATLSWTAFNTVSATITPPVGTVTLPQGSATVSPAATTTYTMSLTNANGTGSATATLTVQGAVAAQKGITGQGVIRGTGVVR